MPVEDVFSRVQQIAALASQAAGDPSIARATVGAFPGLLAEASPQPDGLDGPVGAKPDARPWMPGGTSQALPTSYAWPTSPSYGSEPGLRALSAATGELGVQEEPPGSNDGARIAQYRAASGAEATPGRWCAYFVSWAAAQAGAPLGEEGQGFGAVSQIHDWAARTGRLVPSGEPPRPGDLILFGSEHVGIVQSVGPGDRLTTIEGNHSDRVDRVERSLGEATDFVRI